MKKALFMHNFFKVSIDHLFYKLESRKRIADTSVFWPS